MDIVELKALVAQQNSDLNAAIDALVIVPPSVDPLQAQLDAANAQIASLQASLDSANAKIAKAEADLSASV